MKRLVKKYPPEETSPSAPSNSSGVAPGSWDGAWRKVSSLGLAPPERPDTDIPRLPSDLGTLSDSRLMQIFVQLTQWADYASVQVAMADILEDDAESTLRLEEAKYMARHQGDKVTEVRARRSEDPDIIELSQEVLKAKAFRRLTAAIFSSIERDSNTVSRELSRRIGLGTSTGRLQRFGA
jgi:hypothetical protein